MLVIDLSELKKDRRQYSAGIAHMDNKDNLRRQEVEVQFKQCRSKLEELLPRMFERLAAVPGSIFSRYRSHQDYYEHVKTDWLANNIDTDTFGDDWAFSSELSNHYAKDLYQRACLDSIMSYFLNKDDDDYYAEANSISLKFYMMINMIGVSEEMDILSPKKEAANIARAGGLRKAQLVKPAKTELLKLMSSMAPANGWKSNKEAIQSLWKPLGEFVKKNNISLKEEALDSTISSWSRKDPEIAAAFQKYVTRIPKQIARKSKAAHDHED